MTQFGRALAELNIEILCANSSQAKGRVKRANRTLQDRLVKELRLAGVNDMEAGNAFLPGFLERFSVRAARPEDLHRPLNLAASRLQDILCHREQRYIGSQLTFHYDRKLIILEQTEISKGLVPLCGALRLLRSPPRGPLARRCSSLSRLQQGPACQPNGHRGEQAAWPCAEDREGTAGPSAGSESDDQQREDRLPEAREEYAMCMISLGLTGVGVGRSVDLPEAVTRALSEASVWCSHGALRTATLRSPALDPSAVFNLPRYEEIGIDAWVVAKRQSYQHAVELIQRRRADLVSSADLPVSTLAQAQADGKLLLYEAVETVSDGAAASSSQGFFDVEDAPPWDVLWVLPGHHLELGSERARSRALLR